MKRMREIWLRKGVWLAFGLIGFVVVMTEVWRFCHYWSVGQRVDIEEQVYIIEDLCIGTKEYYERYGEMPMSMSDLLRDGKDSLAWIVWTNDVWRHPIEFAFDSENEKVTFTSFGNDGTIGGIRENGDWIFQVFVVQSSVSNAQKQVSFRRLTSPAIITEAMKPAIENLDSDFQRALLSK